MSITVRTYSDPTAIDWEIVKKNGETADLSSCPVFCESFSEVSVYEKLYSINGIAAVQTLTDQMYPEWNTEEKKLRQLTETDNLIADDAVLKKMIPDSAAPDKNIIAAVKRSLHHNCADVVNCMRLFSELGLRPEDAARHLRSPDLSTDQKMILGLYECVRKKRSGGEFAFDRRLTGSRREREEALRAVEEALNKSYEQRNKKARFSWDSNNRQVVFLGIFNFTPLLLNAVRRLDDASCDIVFLFNYRSDYDSFYDCWKELYSQFSGADIVLSPEAGPPMNGISGNISLARAIRSIENGTYVPDNSLNSINVTCWKNTAEFADSIALEYLSAEKSMKDIIGRACGTEKKYPVPDFMDKAYYAPQSGINKILAAFFPEQYDETHLLNTPVGRFINAVVEMRLRGGDEALNVRKYHHTELRDCLISGMLDGEKTAGHYIGIYNDVYAYIEGADSVSEIVDRLEKLIAVNSASALRIGDNVITYPDMEKDIRRVSFMNVSNDALRELIGALGQIQNTAGVFFKGFRNNKGSLRSFYSRVRDFITERSDEEKNRAALRTLDHESCLVLKKLASGLSSERLKGFPDEPVSVQVIPATLKEMLSAEPGEDTTVRRIVNDFTQLMGGVFTKNDHLDRSGHNWSHPAFRTHLCCMSDKDMCVSGADILPWPLDAEFFGSLMNCGTDGWDKDIYNIYRVSKTRYSDYPKFAFIYTLLFSIYPVELSYVRSEDDMHENELYYILRMLGFEGTPGRADVDGEQAPQINISEVFDESSDIYNLPSPYGLMSCQRLVGDYFLRDDIVFSDRYNIQKYMCAVMTISFVETHRALVYRLIDPSDNSDRQNEKERAYDDYDNIINGVNRSFGDYLNNYELREIKRVIIKQTKKLIRYVRNFSLTSNDSRIMLLEAILDYMRVDPRYFDAVRKRFEERKLIGSRVSTDSGGNVYELVIRKNKVGSSMANYYADYNNCSDCLMKAACVRYSKYEKSSAGYND